LKVGVLVKIDGHKDLFEFGKTGVVIEVLEKNATLDHRLTFCRIMLDNGEVITFSNNNFSVIGK